MRFGQNALTEAVMQTLFTNARDAAGSGGFWGNSLIENEFKSNLWKFYPAPATASNIAGAKRMIEEALHALIERNIASSIEVKHELNSFLITIKTKNNLEQIRIPWQS